MTAWNLLALTALPPDALRGLLAPLGDRITLSFARDRAAMEAALPQAEIVLGDWGGTLAMDAAAVAAAPRLAFVQQPSVGVDGHDLAALSAAGVPLANTAGVSAVAVAEWCLGAALALSRRLVAADAAVRAGGWPQLDLGPRELSGSRVGVVGYGPIGEECARLFRALGCQVSHWTRTPRGEGYAPLEEVVATADVLVVVIALSDETRGLVDPARMKKGAFLVNAARGGVVDQQTLAAALREGHLAGAALDVFEAEPLPESDPLRGLESVLLSPHVAGVTPQSTARLVASVVGNLTAALDGAEIRNVVNDAPARIRRRNGSGK
ncbi:NAD(P)-dependent oxidoreductase [Nonomuraea africana]|uniref:D-3-phosphoglycerate dehydrogenase n=1 Tax=Nonomuraea africana TaxID=46171 RepID=A0ABR9K7S4_9ACTN|nr:NAD(P)-dependent oxidoreductase [Nonomuraea africana]MBE1557950.1 D-3-phosphoglycerate dehydrogenase [Nonomuraea africana]